MTKIYKKNNKLIIEVPFYSERSNPYDDSYCEKMDNVIGIITPNSKCSDPDMGFCYLIDMDYKGKEDQWTNYFYKFDGEEEEFNELCTKLGISIYKYPECAYCGGAIYGSFTFGDKGNMCYDCELNNKK